MLIVVGREDTGELEAQVRGSRHAWDMRLISVDALLRLVDLKESTEEDNTARKIRSVLRPAEFTRLDALIDVLFTAAKDVEDKSSPPVAIEGESSEGSGWEFTPPKLLAAKRDVIIAAVGDKIGKVLIKKTRATYWDVSKEVHAVCTISKRYERNTVVLFWYAYHPAWDTFLSEGKQGLLILGGMNIDSCFVVPREIIVQNLGNLSTTTQSDGGIYWHLKVLETQPGDFVLQMPKTGEHMPLSSYQVALSSAV